MIAILRDALTEIRDAKTTGMDHHEGTSWCRLCDADEDEPHDENCPKRIATEAIRAFDAAPGLEGDEELRRLFRAAIWRTTIPESALTRGLAAVTAHLRGAAK